MNFIEGDLLRRGMNQNNVPVRQVFAYIDNFEQLAQMDNAFISGDN